MRASPLLARPREWIAVLLILFLAGCSAAIPSLSHQTVAWKIHRDDRDDLRQGNLLSIRDRYEQRGVGNLNPAELAVLCDVYIKHLSISKAHSCLDTLQASPAGEKAADRIRGKKALIAYLLGQYHRAAALTANLADDGARYIRALAQAQLGNRRPALDTARQWARAFDPEHVFLAANLYFASGHYKDALTVLQDPERRVARDYSLSGGESIFGISIRPAPLKIDLFDEFGFGLLDSYSYAPAANVYVEFILAKSQLELGDRESARRRLDTILSHPHIGAYREIYWRALFERARIAEMGGNTTQAIALYEQAIEIIECVRASISTEAGRIGFVGDKQDVYASLIRLLVTTGDARTAFAYTERARSRALVDILATQRRFGGRNWDQPEMESILLQLERAESRVLELEGTHRSADMKRSTDIQLVEKKQVLGKFPILKDIVAVDPARARLENIRPHVPADETLLCYFKAKKDWHVFVLTREQFKHKQLELDNLDQMIDVLRRRLENGGRKDTIHVAQELYDRLIRPVAASLIRKLTIVPFGALHYLPFAALHSGSRFLVETHTLRILPSAEVLTILSSEVWPTGRLLALGNPLLDLKGAEQEVRRVAKAYKPSKVLIRHDASRVNFRELAPQYDILHIAAHGEFLPNAPLDSRLMLAPTEGESGDLTVRELYAMQPPLHARITVLSACETALSSIANGDELIGLQRGFLYAGTESIIGSLWRISDDATIYLMEQFYTSLSRCVSPDRALQEAQIKTLKRYPKHGDWAAFTYTGGVY